MNERRFEPGALHGVVSVPGDKSISHRALMLGAVALGITRVDGLNRGADVMATWDAVCALGAGIAEHDGRVEVTGAAHLHSPPEKIDARNSGTTARLLMGLCAGAGIDAHFDGDASLRRRPMERIARPLRTMGAVVETTAGRLPARVQGVVRPAGGVFELELPSAQLKSAILLANLDATAPTNVTGDDGSRDHTERMLRAFGRAVDSNGVRIVLYPGRMHATDIDVPGDLSAAAFFIVAACVTPGSDLVVRNVGMNPTRTGFLEVLQAMGAQVAIENPRDAGNEPVADLHACYAPLRAADIGGALVVRAIDEIPVLAVAAAFAQGTTTIGDAADLRAKESDRLAAIGEMLRAAGIDARERDDGITVVGGKPQTPRAVLRAFGDHRIAMSVAVLGAAAGSVTIDDARCIDISFPGFAPLWAKSQGHAAPIQPQRSPA